MPNKALLTINAVLKNKDIGVLYEGAGIDELMGPYKDIWGTIKNYHSRYHAIPDFDVIAERHPDLEKVEVNGDTKYYVDELRAEFIGNRIDQIITTGAAALDEGNASAAVLAKLQESLAKLNRFSGGATDLDVMDVEQAERHYEEVRERASAMGGLPGIPTGVSFIDSAYPSGLQAGDLVVVLGWTGRAKSLFTTLLACHAHDCGFKPMLVSLEMSGAKVRDRVYTIKGSGLFTNTSLSLGDVDVDDLKKFKKDQSKNSEFIVVTNEGDNLTPNVVEAKIDQHNPKIVILDYAQLASDNANSENMTARMMNQSKEYKRLAVKKGVIVVIISSATAESATSSDEPPTIEQVAWSRQLAYDADLAFAVHKYDDSDLIAIVCRKNRNGPLFAGYLNWDINRGIISEEFNKD